MWCALDRKLMLMMHRPVSRYPQCAKERYLLPYLTQLFDDVIENYKTKKSEIVEDANAPIWVCWLQGLESAPSLVQQLVENIEEKANGHPVNILTYDNIGRYVTIPGDILEKNHHGIMRNAYLADLIRVSVLAEYGGVWIDATDLITRPLPSEVFGCPIYNPKGICADYLHRFVTVDATLWQSYFLGGCKGNVTYPFIRDCLIYYWECYDTDIDYFLFNYIARIARDQIPACAWEFDQIPPNNFLCEMLEDELEKPVAYFPGQAERYLDGDTWLYKLTWKRDYPMKTKDGNPTFASVFFSKIFKQNE